MFESEGYCGTCQLLVLTVTQILATQLDPRVSLKKRIPFQFLVVVPSQGPYYLNEHYSTAIRKIIVKVRVKRGKKKQISIEEYKEFKTIGETNQYKSLLNSHCILSESLGAVAMQCCGNVIAQCYTKGNCKRNVMVMAIVTGRNDQRQVLIWQRRGGRWGQVGNCNGKRGTGPLRN